MVARSQRLPKISVLCFVRPQDLASFRSQTNQHLRRCQLSVMWRSELRQARYGTNLRGQPAPHNPSSRLIPTTTVYLSKARTASLSRTAFSPGHMEVALVRLSSRRCRQQFSVSNYTEVLPYCAQPRTVCGLQHLRDLKGKSKIAGVAGLGSCTAACTIARSCQWFSTGSMTAVLLSDQHAGTDLYIKTAS
jgi:hypothetical protein